MPVQPKLFMKRSFNSKLQRSEPAPIRRGDATVRQTAVRIPALQLALEQDEVTLADSNACAPVRVPGYDVSTERVESGAFFLLGLIGITLIVLAGGKAVEFSENRESIAAAFAYPATNETASTQTAKTKQAVTNVTVIPVSAERMPTGSGKTASHPS
jgi:hypothetical protein